MRRLSLDTQGTKQELVDRLHACLAAQEVRKQPHTVPYSTQSAKVGLQIAIEPRPHLHRSCDKHTLQILSWQLPLHAQAKAA